MQWKFKFLYMLSLVIVIHFTNLLCDTYGGPQPPVPLVINTWAFTDANSMAWTTLHQSKGNNMLDALVEGLSTCERLQCEGTVGFGGSPDESSETTLDAMLMDGSNMNVGAVAGLRQIKDAARVARHVLENTKHTLLVGDAATKFAEMMGFKRENLSTEVSILKFNAWSKNNCQPNFWTNVTPNPKEHCGPYKAIVTKNGEAKNYVDNLDRYRYSFGERNHDTIGMIVVGEKGDIVAGTSTNGAIHKIPGRVGDSPIPGAGAYADNEVGAAVATGDGDILMRFLPTALTVEFMRKGLTPEMAAEKALRRVLKHYPELSGAIVAADRHGKYASACAGMRSFPYSVTNGNILQNTRVEYKDCIKPKSPAGDATLNDKVNESILEIRNLQNEPIKISNKIREEKIDSLSVNRTNDNQIQGNLNTVFPKDESTIDSKQTINQMNARLKRELEELHNGIIEAEQALSNLNNKLTKQRTHPTEFINEPAPDDENIVQSNPNNKHLNENTFRQHKEIKSKPKSKIFFDTNSRITYGNLIPKKFCLKKNKLIDKQNNRKQ